MHPAAIPLATTVIYQMTSQGLYLYLLALFFWAACAPVACLISPCYYVLICPVDCCHFMKFVLVTASTPAFTIEVLTKGLFFKTCSKMPKTSSLSFPNSSRLLLKIDKFSSSASVKWTRPRLGNVLDSVAMCTASL